MHESLAFLEKFQRSKFSADCTSLPTVILPPALVDCQPLSNIFYSESFLSIQSCNSSTSNAVPPIFGLGWEILVYVSVVSFPSYGSPSWRSRRQPRTCLSLSPCPSFRIPGDPLNRFSRFSQISFNLSFSSPILIYKSFHLFNQEE